MIIKKLQLYNFGVYAGDNEFAFDDGEYGGCEAVNVVENCTRALDIIRGK